MATDNRVRLAFEAPALDYIVNVLRTRPFGEVAALMADIAAQVQAHNTLAQMQTGPAMGPVGALNGAGATSAPAKPDAPF